MGGGIPLSADSLNHIEEGIAAIDSLLIPTAVMLEPNTNLLNYNTYTSSSYKIGNCLMLQCSIILTKDTDWKSEELTLFNLPAAFCPASDRTIYRCVDVINNDGTKYLIRGLKVYTNGKVVFLNNTAVGTPSVCVVAIKGIMIPLT